MKILWEIIFSLIAKVEKLEEQLEESNKLVEKFRLLDRLTGLKNQTALREFGNAAFVSAKRNKISLSLLFIDLDNFKRINDILGHHVGDKILIDFSKVLKTADGIKRDVDIISRYGGDEFVVVLTDAGEHHAKKVRDSIRTEFKRVFIEGVNRNTDPHLFDLSFRVSIGIATCPGDKEVKNFNDLLGFADIEMYKIKELGRREDIISIMSSS